MTFKVGDVVMVYDNDDAPPTKAVTNRRYVAAWLRGSFGPFTVEIIKGECAVIANTDAGIRDTIHMQRLYKAAISSKAELERLYG